MPIYYDYKDLQVSLYRFGQAQILNAAKSEIYGLDAQIRFDATDSFQVSAGGAWVHARYKTFRDAPVYTPCLTTLSPTAPAGFENCLTGGISFPVVPTQLTNTTMQRTPEFPGNLAMTYRTELAGGELALSGNLYYSSSFFFGPSGVQFRQGDNVTNSRYLTQVQYNNNGVGGNWSKPTTFGVEFGAKF